MKLTPATILHAEFNPAGQLVVGTLTQVAVFATDGELTNLLELPRAQASWHPIWLNHNLIAVKDESQMLMWQPQTGTSAGPWQPREHSINGIFNVDERLLLSYADGTELLQTASTTAAQLPSTPEFSQLGTSSTPLRQLVASDNGVTYKAYAGGHIEAIDTESQQPIWRRQLDHGNYLRAMTLDTHSLFVILQKTIDPFVRGRGQMVIQVDRKSGKMIQASALNIESQAVSALADSPYLYIGGSENCLFAQHTNEPSVRLCYPRTKRWGENSGQVIALYKNSDKLHAVTSSGYLQIWRKQDIVSLMTDK